MPTHPSLPRACVIGAGASGITAAKALLEAGIPFDCFEMSDRVGGNWVFGNANGVSSAYRELYINTSRERMEYSDFPMPRHYPDFPHHSQIAEYFDAYVDHFGLREHITFRTRVEQVRPLENGGYEVTLDGGQRLAYDCVLVANGHHWDPRWPEPPFPGSFDGVEMHAHHYTDSEALRDKRVVILGMGNSAMDIAVESSYVAERTILAARRGAHVLPKYLFGKPADQLAMSPRIPWFVRAGVLRAIVRVVQGRMEDYGLPAPDHKLGEAHPTISGRILDRIAHGTIHPKPNITELQGRSVRFEDGSVEQADVIVYCTGYRVSFPFFDPEFISAPDNDLPLFRRVFHPERHDVFFIGLLQPLGAVMPLAEAQGRWVADYLRGRYHLPPRAELLADMERERRAMFRRYVSSKRHTMQVDFDDYLLELDRERRAGADRARAAGMALPVAPRTAAGAEQAA